MRERVLGTLRRIYGPPYPRLWLFLLVPTALHLLKWMPAVTSLDLPGSAIDWGEITPWLEMWREGFRDVLGDPREVLYVLDLVLVRLVSMPLLIPLSILIGLRFVWRATGPSLRTWGALWAAAGAYGLAWFVLASKGGQPGPLPFFVEPMIWAGGAALFLPMLFSLTRPGRPVRGPLRRLPALTFLVLLAGHWCFFSGGPIGQLIQVFDLDLWAAYRPSIRAWGSGAEAIFPWTRTVVALPVFLLFVTVALRDISVPAAVGRWARSLRARPGSTLLALAVMLGAAVIPAGALSADWILHAYSAETRAAQVVNFLLVVSAFALLQVLFLYFAVRTVWCLTETEVGATESGETV